MRGDVVEHDAQQPYREPVEQVELCLRRRAIGRAQPEHQQQIPRHRPQRVGVHTGAERR